MPQVEYWIPTGEFTADGKTRFVEAALGPCHGRPNIKVELDEYGGPLSAEVIRPSMDEVP